MNAHERYYTGEDRGVTRKLLKIMKRGEEIIKCEEEEDGGAEYKKRRLSFC